MSHHKSPSLGALLLLFLCVNSEEKETAAVGGCCVRGGLRRLRRPRRPRRLWIPHQNFGFLDGIHSDLYEEMRFFKTSKLTRPLTIFRLQFASICLAWIHMHIQGQNHENLFVRYSRFNQVLGTDMRLSILSNNTGLSRAENSATFRAFYTPL